ncbi:MAG: GNAT family N-acetyltransferase [Chloroflexi bacterium]|nr:GNAT family N-acetyltransferase [Chloroflexota bacterium]
MSCHEGSDTSLRTFGVDHLSQAAELLAQRVSRLHQIEPALPRRLEEPRAALSALTELWGLPHTSGVAAVAGDRLEAYLIGGLKLEPIWGRSAWVRGPGLALADGTDTTLIADLYAELGEAWVRDGVYYHFALMPVAEPEVIHAWFALSFGLEQVHAAIDLRAVEASPASTEGITIRRAGPDDADTLAGFSELIWRELVRAPVWGLTLPEAVAEIRSGYAELASDDTATVWIAEHSGRPVGLQGYWEHEDPDPVLVPEKAVTMSVVSTLPEMRRRGIQSALTRHGLAQARAAGYEFCETDWRSANRGVARMLPRRGFRPIAYRLVRRVDARIAWAPGRGGLSSRS